METIEVYKTDIDDASVAKTILDVIHKKFPESDPSIDLDDCDKVLRIKYPALKGDELSVNKILNQLGYSIELLP